MKVYIVISGFEREPYTIEGIFIDKNKAQSLADKIHKEYRFDFVEIKEYQIKE